MLKRWNRMSRLLLTMGLAALSAGCPSKPATGTGESVPRRDTIPPRSYPVDHRGFSPVDKALQKAFAREDMVVDDDEGSLNPYVMKVISAFPPATDGTYPYHCSWDPREYDIYNGVTQDLWYQGQVVAKAYPDGSRCSYCCGLTFELFVRAMKLRNVQKGMARDDFNGMDFYDLFNLLQLWYIEGKGDSPQKGITLYGLGRIIDDWDDARPGDFCDFSRNNKSGHSVVFVEWTRNEEGRIIGLKYFSSNRSGVGYATEHFSDTGGKLLRKWVRLARVGAIEDYKPFNRLEIPCRNAYAPVQP